MQDLIPRANAEATLPASPGNVLLFLNVHFDWLYSAIVPAMRAAHGTRFVLVANGGADRLAFARKIAGPDDQVMDFTEIQRLAEATVVDPAADAVKARANEQRLGISYLRDIIYSDRVLATYYFGFAPGSSLSNIQPAPIETIIARVNFYLDYFEKLLKEHKIDLVIERVGGISTSSCIAAAMGLGIPVTFPRTSRIGGQALWSHGPFVGRKPILEAYNRTPIPDAPPSDELKAPDYIARLSGEEAKWTSVRWLGMRFLRETVDHAILWSRARAAGRKLRRIPWTASRRADLSKFRLYRYISSAVVSEIGEITAKPFVLFLLQLEPEYSTLSLAREFNDTEACIKQLSLSLPAGYRLVVKEHVSAIGNRDTSFYERIKRLPNVLLADHRIRGPELARHAAAVATVTGTIGVEAALLGKPAIVFGRHVEYAILPSVEVVLNIAELPTHVRSALEPRTTEEIAEIRRAAARYAKAMETITFERPKAVYSGGKVGYSSEQASRAIALLIESWRGQLDQTGGGPDAAQQARAVA